MDRTFTVLACVAVVVSLTGLILSAISVTVAPQSELHSSVLTLQFRVATIEDAIERGMSGADGDAEDERRSDHAEWRQYFDDWKAHWEAKVAVERIGRRFDQHEPIVIAPNRTWIPSRDTWPPLPGDGNNNAEVHYPDTPAPPKDSYPPGLGPGPTLWIERLAAPEAPSA